MSSLSVRFEVLKADYRWELNMKIWLENLNKRDQLNI